MTRCHTEVDTEKGMRVQRNKRKKVSESEEKEEDRGMKIVLQQRNEG